MFMNKLLVLLIFLLPAVSFASEPVADELYEVFRDARKVISTEGPAGTIKYYSREWLEYKLKSAFESAEKDHSKINYTKDDLWAGFQGLGVVNSVYSYSKIEYEGKPAISIKVTSGECNYPSTLIYAFNFEEGEWRISMKVSNSYDTGWFHDSLEPMETFPSFKLLDRSEIWKEIFGELPEKRPCS